jgi:hypothetical protein
MELYLHYVFMTWCLAKQEDNSAFYMDENLFVVTNWTEMGAMVLKRTLWRHYLNKLWQPFDNGSSQPNKGCVLVVYSSLAADCKYARCNEKKEHGWSHFIIFFNISRSRPWNEVAKFLDFVLRVVIFYMTFFFSKLYNLLTIHPIILFMIRIQGAHGSLVIKVLDYKPEGRWFETPMGWNFKFT